MFDPYDSTYQDTIGNRTKKAINEEEKARLLLDPAVHHEIAVVIATLAGSKTMTTKQYHTLREVVILANKDATIQRYPSPSVLWDTEPDFQSFIRALPSILESYNQRVTINNLIRYVRGYDWKKVGYLAWKATHGNQTTEVVVSNEPDSSPFSY